MPYKYSLNRELDWNLISDDPWVILQEYKYSLNRELDWNIFTAFVIGNKIVYKYSLNRELDWNADSNFDFVDDLGINTPLIGSWIETSSGVAIWCFHLGINTPLIGSWIETSVELTHHTSVGV